MRAALRALPLVTVVALCSTASAVPMQITHQGRLLDATGVPLEGKHDVALAIYSSSVGGSPLWGEAATLDFSAGYYSVTLGQLAANPLTPDVFSATSWLGLAVDGGAELKRQPIGSVPYAIRAEVAGSVDGGTVDASSISVGGKAVVDSGGKWVGAPIDPLSTLSCAGDQIVRYNAAFKQWTCSDDKVLTSADVIAAVEGSPISLASGSKVGGVAISTLTTTDVKDTVETSPLNLNASTTLGGQPITTKTYSGTDFALSDKSCGPNEVVTGIDAKGELTCTTGLIGHLYRWAVWSSYNQAQGWYTSNNSEFFGGVAPSTWGDGGGIAASMSSNTSTLRTLFTRVGPPLTQNQGDANVYTDEWYYYSSTNSRHVGVLLRIENTTTSPITWSPCWYKTSFGSWGEYASIALNGSNVWSSGGSDYYGASSNYSCHSLSIPAKRRSTAIFISGSTGPSGTRGLQLAFANGSLTLPSGLRFVDDLDTKLDGWDK